MLECVDPVLPAVGMAIMFVMGFVSGFISGRK